MHGFETDVASAVGFGKAGRQLRPFLGRGQVLQPHVAHFLDGVTVQAGIAGVDVDDRIVGRVMDGDAQVRKLKEALPAPRPRFGLFALGDVVHDRVHQRPITVLGPTCSRFDITDCAVGATVTELDLRAVCSMGRLQFGTQLIQRQGVDVADVHLSQARPRPAIEALGGKVRIDDLAALGVDDQHHRKRIVEDVVVMRFYRRLRVIGEGVDVCSFTV